MSASLFHHIRIPPQLESITCVDPDEVSNPAWLGFKEGQVDSIWRAVEGLYRSGLYPAVSFCLRRHGEIVLNRSIGHLRGNGPGDTEITDKVLATPSTPFCLFSASKAVTAMLIHLLAERHLVNLLDPVSHYVPAFGCNGKQHITLHQVLCHRSGIPMIPGDIAADLIFDDHAVQKLIFESKPIHPQGHYYAYHAVTGGYVLGEVIKAVTGASVDDFIRREICEPMGMRYFTYGVKPEDVDKVAVNYATGMPITFPVSSFIKRALGVAFHEVMRISNDPRFHQVVIPAGNLMATAEEGSRFFQCLLDGGLWEGKRYFDPMTIYRATADIGRLELDRVFWIPMRYTAGMMRGGNPVGLFGPVTPNAYGHLGLTNNFVWADPDRAISVALLTSGNPILGPHLPRLGWLLTQISRNCARISKPS